MLFPNAAGLDIGSAEIVTALPPDRGSEPVCGFTTFTPDLKRLVAWLVEHGIDTVAMESTGIYWVPIRPDDEICILRSLLRHRAQLIEHRSPHILHMQSVCCFHFP